MNHRCDLGVQSSEPLASGWPRRGARSVNNARGSSTSLRVRYLVTRSPIVLLLEGLRPFLRRVRVSRRVSWSCSLLGAFFALFRNFAHFFCIFFALLCQHRLFDRFFRFFIDLGRIWGGSWEGLGKFFRGFLGLSSKIAILSKYWFYCSKTTIFKARRLLKLTKKLQKIDKKSMRIWSRKIKM